MTNRAGWRSGLRATRTGHRRRNRRGELLNLDQARGHARIDQGYAAGEDDLVIVEQFHARGRNGRPCWGGWQPSRPGSLRNTCMLRRMNLSMLSWMP